MIKFLMKIVAYGILVLLVLEILVRIFHLHNDRPERYVDVDNLNKWKPGQEGYAVYGNRRQNFSKYRINNSGYNSYREFNPTRQGIEIAIVGDSFIEGFHQDVDNSIGKKIENQLDNVEVYEFGHSAYDLADQLYTIHKHPEKFNLIDYVIILVRYEDDLSRPKYEHINRQPNYTFLRYSKLFVYVQDIGIIDSVKAFVQKLFFLKQKDTSTNALEEKDKVRSSIANFDSLLKEYGFDKNRFVFLIDGSITNDQFLNYLERENFQVIDFSKAFKKTKEPKTLIYDQHWNDLGRTIIGKLIAEYVEKKSIVN